MFCSLDPGRMRTSDFSGSIILHDVKAYNHQEGSTPAGFIAQSKRKTHAQLSKLRLSQFSVYFTGFGPNDLEMLSLS